MYVKQMLAFRFGISFMSQRPVWQELAERLPNTLLLLFPGTPSFCSLRNPAWRGGRQRKGQANGKGGVAIRGDILFLSFVFRAARAAFALGARIPDLSPPRKLIRATSYRLLESSSRQSLAYGAAHSFPGTSWIRLLGALREKPHGEGLGRGLHYCLPGQRA